MSRIGKKPIQIPDKVEIKIDNNNLVTVKGPLGELQQKIDKNFKITIKEKILKIERPDESKKNKALHGLWRALINNMVIGVSQGFSKTLELVGVGFRVRVNKQILDLSLGYAHNIMFEIPEQVQVEVVQERRQNPKIVLKSINKQLLGQIAAKIRSFYKPEPYKGKGIRYIDEIVRRKAGKAATVAGT